MSNKTTENNKKQETSTESFLRLGKEQWIFFSAVAGMVGLFAAHLYATLSGKNRTGFSVQEIGILITQVIIICTYAFAWVAVRIRTKKRNTKEREMCVATMNKSRDVARESRQTCKKIKEDITNLRKTTDDALVLHILNPAVMCELEAIEKIIDKSHEKICECAEILTTEECAKGKIDIEELHRHQREVENNRIIIDEKKNTLNLIFDLVQNATKNIREPYIGISGCYFMQNVDNNDDVKILKISKNDEGTDFEATVYEEYDDKCFEILYAKNDKRKKAARLVLYCSQHAKVELYSISVDLDKRHRRIHECTYIKHNMDTAKKYEVMCVAEDLMGCNHVPLSEAHIEGQNFQKIIDMAIKEKKHLIERTSETLV